MVARKFAVVLESTEEEVFIVKCFELPLTTSLYSCGVKCRGG